ncbi:MAG TPA: class I SAM-dependent methyltransferase [Chryseosolibacter sp.]
MNHSRIESHCRFCGSPLSHTFVDLGMSPLCQDHVKPEEMRRMEPFYPLHAYVCTNCFLVQLEDYVSPEEIFNDYAYFSSYSTTWLEHAHRYTDAILARFPLSSKSLVAEIASNDGYLLQYFLERHIPVVGVEPAANVAEVAMQKGINTEVKFFGTKTAVELIEKYGQADLIVGNNVLAHVPDLNDFVSALRLFLKPGGVITMEFPHLLRLVQGNQFDTIYHEHFSYLSFGTVERIFKHHGLVLFDVEELGTHGGSIRIYARHTEDNSKPVDERVSVLKELEISEGMFSLQFYDAFAEKVNETKRRILEFLIAAKRERKMVVGYGAPGKGNTLLNYCGIRTDFIDFTVDRSPHKQNNYLPGTLIPIYHPDEIAAARPDYVFILPWNLKEEIMESMAFIANWGGKFVVPIPELTVFDHAYQLD